MAPGIILQMGLEIISCRLVMKKYLSTAPKLWSKHTRTDTRINDSDDFKGGSYKMKDVLRRGSFLNACLKAMPLPFGRHGCYFAPLR